MIDKHLTGVALQPYKQPYIWTVGGIYLTNRFQLSGVSRTSKIIFSLEASPPFLKDIFSENLEVSKISTLSISYFRQFKMSLILKQEVVCIN